MRAIPSFSGLFTSQPAYYSGLPPPGSYMQNAPSVRSPGLPPLVQPTPGRWGFTKTATPPYANPSWWAGVRGANGDTLGS